MDKNKKVPQKEKIFSIKNFIEKEAEEEIEVGKKDINKLNSLKDTQYSSEVNNEENNSYGISSDNDTEKIENQIIANRVLLNKENMKKEKNKKIKRKNKPLLQKKNNKKRTMKYIENNVKKVDKALGIINGKLNICFEENRENKNIDNINMNKTPEKKYKIEDDEDVLLLKISNERKKISNANKKNNKSFIKRIKDNENFIKKNNIIINEGSKRSKSQIVKRNSETILLHPKLKLYNLKGAFLNKKKK